MYDDAFDWVFDDIVCTVDIGIGPGDSGNRSELDVASIDIAGSTAWQRYRYPAGGLIDVRVGCVVAHVLFGQRMTSLWAEFDLVAGRRKIREYERAVSAGHGRGDDGTRRVEQGDQHARARWFVRFLGAVAIVVPCKAGDLCRFADDETCIEVFDIDSWLDGKYSALTGHRVDVGVRSVVASAISESR